MSKTFTTLNYLKTMVEMRNQMAKGAPKYHYSSQEHFVLEEGKAYEYAKKPKGVTYGKWGHCFSNAYHLAQRWPERYTYCEGFATSIIPTLHAWCIDTETGFVVDNTWRHDHHDIAADRGYHGVEFPIWIASEIVYRKGTYGLIDAWNAGWPLMKEKLPDLYGSDFLLSAWLNRILSEIKEA
jgi:hypothetical protein